MEIPAQYLDHMVKCPSCQQSFTAHPLAQASVQWTAKQQKEKIAQQLPSTPPPPPVPDLATSHIHILVGGKQRGPYMLDQIRNMWSTGTLTADATWWTDGMTGWAPIQSLPLSSVPSAVATPPPQHSTQPPKNPGVAAVLSFFVPGLGQIYNGQIGMGIVLLILTILLYYTIILGVVLHLYLVYDAYTTATKMNNSKA